MGDTNDLYGTPIPTFQGGPDGTRLPASFFGELACVHVKAHFQFL